MRIERPPAAPRCWTEEDLSPGRLVLEPSEIRHLEKVRRVRKGDPVCVLNGRGQLGNAVHSGEGVLEIREVISSPRPSPELSLYLGALKPSAWEEVLRHATELGVSRIIRVECSHSVSKIGGKAEKKSVRWRELLIEACKQSANPWLPDLQLVDSVEEACSDPRRPEMGLVAQLEGDPSTPGQIIPLEIPTSVAVWIGPEGDFTPEETAAIRKTGAFPVTLGPRVLRSETAALSLLSRLRLHG